MDQLGAAAAFGSWDDVGGAAAQLAVNVAGLVVAGLPLLNGLTGKQLALGLLGRPESLGALAAFVLGVGLLLSRRSRTKIAPLPLSAKAAAGKGAS